MHDLPAGRLARVLRARRAMSERRRRGELTRDEYLAAVRALFGNGSLLEPVLTRPWWADDLGWLSRTVAQAVHGGVLREGEHVVFLRRQATRLLRVPFAGCECLAVHLDSALPGLAARGFSLSRAEVDRALAGEAAPGLVLEARAAVYFAVPRVRRSAVVLDWSRVQALGASPRRGDPRGL